MNIIYLFSSFIILLCPVRLSLDSEPEVPQYSNLTLRQRVLVNSSPYRNYFEAHGGVVFNALLYKTGRWRVRFPMMSLEFFIDIILPVAL